MACAVNKNLTMTPFTSNYETIKKTSSKDQSLDLAPISGNMTTPIQGKIQSTFLQSVRSNKFFIALVVVVFGAGLMAYNANQVPSSIQFRLGDYAAIVDGSKGGGFTGNQNGGASGGGRMCNAPCYQKDGPPSQSPI